jgi:hypothetical protein
MGKKWNKVQERLSRPPRTVGIGKIRHLVDTLSIQSMAHHCGVSLSKVCAWCTGDGVPETEHAHEVLAQFGISQKDWSTPVRRTPHAGHGDCGPRKAGKA